jgi:hypothetical protein
MRHLQAAASNQGKPTCWLCDIVCLRLLRPARVSNAVIAPIFVTSPQPGYQENLFLLHFGMSVWRHFCRSCEKKKWSRKCHLQLSSWYKLAFGALTAKGEIFGSRDQFLSAASNAPFSDLSHPTIFPENQLALSFEEVSSSELLFSAE